MEKGTIKDQWFDLQARIQENWPALTDDDVNMIAGRRDQLVGKIQERLGITADQADLQVVAWQAHMGCPWGE